MDNIVISKRIINREYRNDNQQEQTCVVCNGKKILNLSKASLCHSLKEFSIQKIKYEKGKIITTNKIYEVGKGIFLHEDCCKDEIKEIVKKEGIINLTKKEKKEEKVLNVSNELLLELIEKIEEKKERDDSFIDKELLNNIVEIITEKAKVTFQKECCNDRISQTNIPNFSLYDESFFQKEDFLKIINFLEKFETEDKLTYFYKLFESLNNNDGWAIFGKLFELLSKYDPEKVKKYFLNYFDDNNIQANLVSFFNKLKETKFSEELVNIFIQEIIENKELKDEQKLKLLKGIPQEKIEEKGKEIVCRYISENKLEEAEEITKKYNFNLDIQEIKDIAYKHISENKLEEAEKIAKKYNFNLDIQEIKDIACKHISENKLREANLLAKKYNLKMVLFRLLVINIVNLLKSIFIWFLPCKSVTKKY